MIVENENKFNMGEIYDAIYDLSDDYLEFILFFLGDTKTAMELGVGTGRMSIPVAMKRYTLYGIDNNTEMLEKCREKILLHNLEKKIFIFKEDITAFNLGIKVDTCFFTSNTYMLINTIEERLAALINCSNHLNMGGTLLIILNNPCEFMKKDHEITQHKRGTLSNNSVIEITEYRKIDLINWERIGFDEFHNIDNDEKIRVPVRHGIVTQSELELLAYLSGFSIIHTYGNYNKDPLTSMSKKAIYILKKIKDINNEEF